MSLFAASWLGSPGRLGVASTWTPTDLGSSLYAWWDASRADLITQSGGLVSSWKDIVGAYDVVQAIGASKPTYGATAFGGYPAVVADGVDDELTCTGIPATIPVGALPVSEEWYLVDQLLTIAEDAAASRNLGSYGGAATATTRRVLRTTPGNDRARVIEGATNLTNTSVVFTGRHVVRVIANGSTISLEVDGLAASSTLAQTITISSARLRFFSDALTTPTNFGKVAMAARLFTALLSDADATRMYGYLNKRK